MTDNKKEEVVLPQSNNKPAWLREVEEDAVYITNKRFQEAEEEKKREADKKARQENKK